MAEHKRKTKEERYSYKTASYWGVSILFHPQNATYPWGGHPATHANLYVRINDNYFDYNLLRAELKRLLKTNSFVLLNRWKAMPSEYKSFVQVYERETTQDNTGSANAIAKANAETRKS